jgi:tetratricopeptide (TPR) repeat protein
MIGGLALAAGCNEQPLSTEGERLFRTGHKDYQEGRYAQADQNFSQVIQRDAQSWALSEVHYFRGLTRLSLNRRDDAKSDFARGASRKGRHVAQVYCAIALANLEHEDGNDARAVHLYQQILRQNSLGDVPVDAVLYRHGVSQQRLGRWSEADETLARLIHKHPDSTLRDAAQRRFQSAFFTVQVGAFADPRSAETMAAKLRQAQWPVRISVAAEKGRTLHKVTVGRYQTYAQVASAAASLKQQGYSGMIVP